MRQYLNQQKKPIALLASSALSAWISVGCSTKSTVGENEQITVYTAVEADQLQRYKWALRQAYPELKVRWVRDSTGVITAKLLAEQKNPQADVVMGVALTSILMMEQNNMLQPYKPKYIEQLKTDFYSQKDIPTWTGMTAWESAICVNTFELKKKNLPIPRSWKDLTLPIYKGMIVMPNPVSSGTGYLDVTAWMQLFGEQQAWNYMRALDQNITQYVHSGSKPCKMAAQGETLIGISFGYPGYKLKARGAPLEIIYPKEGLGWEMEASAIIKGTKKLTSAQKFIDWTVSQSANQVYAHNFPIVAHQKVTSPNPDFDQNLSTKLIKHNFYWAATQREKILKQWSAQFEH
ncbi:MULTISPECIES: putative 2-aminoethylphosphonate ABC transporter substrate-binding protein [unclassified Acinetobacter]|uniref:putative 2-aminoethylphosphonate ABC transporter substrate-binding protein n=1 Tax=unclassified Acinetobacter TaxID=196816 RepID=UPI002934B89C|nr:MULTISPECIES: putative 2-aminoethylphosphonate ABC transporter substrate-binding protein [unclassified Acinetobacter]WOE33327.1 putative 2-aminoethylphosphonate ABC transporter substrate-binding protein [Acinetobacter sp. SAAs470]WOE37014.1 putative 2-aminoethylphosphonate ABC transporter substrate-binding protein [Acinetobacter sp. SAAs474]